MSHGPMVGILIRCRICGAFDQGCLHCNGSGRELTSGCNNDLKCSYCSGTGYYYKENKCGLCQGIGKFKGIICGHCNGRGICQLFASDSNLKSDDKIRKIIEELKRG